MSKISALIVALLIANVPASGRQSRSSTDGKIEGIVVDARTRMPLAEVSVVLSSTQPNYSPRTLTTRADGAFVFDRVTPSAFPYSVRARRDGYRMEAPGAQTFQMADARSVRVEVRLSATGVVAGRVFDEDGQPIAGAKVELLPGGQSASTDSDGRYRFADVLPGEYLVKASRARAATRADMRGVRTPIFLTDPFSVAYYPGVASRDLAARFAVAPASAFNVADLVLSPPSPGRLSGRIENSLVFALESDPMLEGYQRGLRQGWYKKPQSFGADDAAAYSFFLVPRDKLPGESSAIGPIPDFNDDAQAFELRNIPAGTYELYAVFQPNTLDGYIWQPYAGHGLVKVTEQAVTGVEIKIEPNADVIGKIVLDRSVSSSVDFRHVYPSPISVDPLPEVLDLGSRLSRLAFVEKDGTFRMPGGVAPGRYWLTFQEWRLPAGVYLNSATMEGASIPGEPLTLVGASTNRVVMTLNGDGGSVQGTVSDRNRRGIPKASIVLLSLDDRREDPPSYRFSAANERGEFVIDGVRPDSYLLFAFDPPVDESALRNRGFVTPYLMRGRKLEVKKGEQVRVDLDAIVRP